MKIANRRDFDAWLRGGEQLVARMLIARGASPRLVRRTLRSIAAPTIFGWPIGTQILDRDDEGRPAIVVDEPLGSAIALVQRGREARALLDTRVRTFRLVLLGYSMGRLQVQAIEPQRRREAAAERAKKRAGHRGPARRLAAGLRESADTWGEARALLPTSNSAPAEVKGFRVQRSGVGFRIDGGRVIKAETLRKYFEREKHSIRP